jgi:hypothetical protein
MLIRYLRRTTEIGTELLEYALDNLNGFQQSAVLQGSRFISGDGGPKVSRHAARHPGAPGSRTALAEPNRRRVWCGIVR